MGLDNGILLKSRHKINKEDIPSYVVVEEYDETNYDEETRQNIPTGITEYDIAYWRKCWNIRAMIYKYAKADPDKPDEWQFDLTPEQLLGIQNDLVEIIKDPSKWDDDMSIWTFDEQKEHLMQQIINLGWVANYVREHQDCYVQFYDSY